MMHPFHNSKATEEHGCSCYGSHGIASRGVDPREVRRDTKKYNAIKRDYDAYMAHMRTGGVHFAGWLPRKGLSTAWHKKAAALAKRSKSMDNYSMHMKHVRLAEQNGGKY